MSLRRLGLAPAVLALGIVSLLTDVSSEMIYPLLPAFVTAVLGGGAAAIGLIEGVAEATAALLKIVSGRITDASGRRRPLVIAGYSLSGLARPAIGLAGAWPAVLVCRFFDRIGKGLRTSPRDALIADWTPPERRGTAYGFHRALDHFGAVLGPLAAAALWAAGVGYRGIFLAALVPAVLVVLVILVAVREAEGASTPARGAAHDARLEGWPPPRGAGLLAGAFLGALGMPADAFLLLLLVRAGLAPATVALLWSAHNVVRFAATFGAGLLADRLPRLPLVASGWIVRAVFLGTFALASSTTQTIAVFLVYGLAAGLSEPAERALVGDLVKRAAHGRAFGLYHAAVGLGALPAGVLFGAFWDRFGASVALGVAAAVVACGSTLLVWAGRAQAPGRTADTSDRK